ncbi:MAG: urease accessory protein UreD [Ruminococcus sp.]|nr:urease accessory protein UreD [Ruminococcus sp.]
MNGTLRLKTIVLGSKTVAEDIFFTPPFKLYSPFYENCTAKFISMCAAAGMLAGDRNEISLDIGKGCNVHFTDQGYQKLFDTNGSCSEQKVNICVGENASLKYLPHPIMTFGGCSHDAVNTVDIKSSSKLVFAEIYCCGRTAMGETFALKRFHSRTQIRIDGKTDLIDNTLIEPEKFPVRKLGFFEGYTHTGILYAYTQKNLLTSDIQKICDGTDSGTSAACSKTEKGFTVRALSYSAEKIERLFSNICKAFDLTY